MKKWIIACLFTGYGLCSFSACLPSKGSRADKGTAITVATFNIRYDNSDDGVNRWECRKDTVATLVRERGWEIIGMQEVLHHQVQDMLGRLPGYAMVGVGRDDGKTRGEFAPIFYDKERFRLLDSHTFWLSQYPDSAGFIGWDGACTRIATWAKFHDTYTEKELLFVNTHFDHVGQQAMRNAAHLILDRMEKIADGIPVVLTGDFNVPENSETYRILTADSNFVLRDAYKKSRRKEKGVTYTYHNFGRAPETKKAKIDYIFVSPQVKVLSVGILSENPTTSGHVSDHNPHWGVIKVR